MNRPKRDSVSPTYQPPSPRPDSHLTKKSPKLPNITSIQKLSQKFFISSPETCQENTTKKMFPPSPKYSHEIQSPLEERKSSISQIKSDILPVSLKKSGSQSILDESTDNNKDQLEINFLKNEVNVLKTALKVFVILT